jgi:hypothetical protein
MSSVDVVGHYAYTVEARLDRLTILDVADPANPVIVSSLRDTTHLDGPTRIKVVGTTAYVDSKGNGNADITGSSMSIFDVSDPAHPAFLGWVNGDPRIYGAYGLDVAGSTVYVAAQGCVAGPPCPVSGGNALTVIDASDPANPVITGSVSQLPQTSHLDSVVVSGNHAYGTAFYTGRVTAFDVSDPANPTIAGSLKDTQLTWANDIRVLGSHAYVVDQASPGGELAVVDISDPAHMQVVGSVVDATNLDYAYTLEINSRFAFVGAPRSHALTVVDLRDPTNPQVVASIGDPVALAYPVGLDVVGDTAYVGAYCPRDTPTTCDPAQHGGFTTVDVSAFDAAPDTAITLSPLPISTTSTAAFAFTSTRRGATFACSLDGVAATPCTPPVTYTGLADGGHTFSVASTSLAGVADPTPDTYSWTVATSAPDTQIDSAPTGSTSSTTASIAFSSTPPGATFTCQLDGGSWNACTSPLTLTGLADGSHDLAVAAIGPAGTDPSPAHAVWTVDTVAPHVSISSAPPGLTNASTAHLVFGSSDATATFQCRLDGGSWSACSSPANLSGLANGGHAFDVRASDPAGNVSAPATATWTVDTVAPHVTISSGPSGTLTATSATFAFVADDAAATLECRLDNGAWVRCASPAGYLGLGVGTHRFSVRATDAAGNVGTATRDWSVAAVPAPLALTAQTNATRATFSFTGAGGFVCSIDGSPFTPCAAPVAYRRLASGRHVFAVRDAGGTTADRRWRVSGKGAGRYRLSGGRLRLSAGTLPPRGTRLTIAGAGATTHVRHWTVRRGRAVIRLGRPALRRLKAHRHAVLHVRFRAGGTSLSWSYRRS